MAVMRSLGRGDWVVVTVGTVVLESYTEGPDGAAIGSESGHLQHTSTTKSE